MDFIKQVMEFGLKVMNFTLRVLDFTLKVTGFAGGNPAPIYHKGAWYANCKYCHYK